MAKEWIVSEEDLGCDGAYLSHDEVVRCKDCVYCKRFNDVYQLPKLDMLICRHNCDEDEVTENDYCSWGERREDGKIG